MIIYNPSTEYRLIDMHSTMNLNRIYIMVYWKDTFGNIYPLELHPGCAPSFKHTYYHKTASHITATIPASTYLLPQYSLTYLHTYTASIYLLP
ncbi:MAG: hypothetical protein ACKPKO_43125 [Candidatus Fonsibacter sp.]